MLANVAIPTFFPHWIAGLFALCPIVALEAAIVSRRLSIPYAWALTACGSANVRSTLVGIPVAYFVSLFITIPFGLVMDQFINRDSNFGRFLFGVFLFGGTQENVPEKAALFATLVLLVPYYYASVRIECRIMQKHLPTIEPAKIRSATIAMNRASYAILLLIGLSLFLVF